MLPVAFGSSSKSESVKQYSSEAEMLQGSLEQNQSRCEFFKHYQYLNSDKLGTVSSAFTSASSLRLSLCKNGNTKK